MEIAKTCARCDKQFSDWLPPVESRRGNGCMVCEGCQLQEIFEDTGAGPRGKLQFPPKPYSGPKYWEK